MRSFNAVYDNDNWVQYTTRNADMLSYSMISKNEDTLDRKSSVERSMKVLEGVKQNTSISLTTTNSFKRLASPMKVTHSSNNHRTDSASLCWTDMMKYPQPQNLC